VSAPSLVALGATLDDLREAARAADAAGFESVWAAEFYDRSATIALAAMAEATGGAGGRIQLGSGIMYGFGRVPLVLAAEARDLDSLSGGRLVLGLGTGTRRMMQGWHGLDGLHPAPRIEELVPLLRKLWRLHEGPIKHEGRFYRLDLTPTAPPAKPLRTDIPVYLAGVNPRMVEAAGAVGDGLVGHPLFTRRYVEEVVRPALAKGADRTGRPADVPVAGYLICAIDDDGDRARTDAAAQIAFYSTVKSYDRIHALHGFEDATAAIRERWRSGDLAGMVGAVPPEMVEAMALAGTPAEVRDQAAGWKGVYEKPLLYPPSMGGGKRTAETVARITETFAGVEL
jgi:probable F420-dependent oxidoreductase